MKRIALAAVWITTLVVVSGCKVVVDGQSTYEVCDFSSDCISTLDSCVTVTSDAASDSICTRGCVDNLDCPGTGVCVDTGSGGTCLQSCLSSGICEPGWECADIGAADVCLPASGGPTGTPTYGTCDFSSDCGSTSDSCVSVTNGADTDSQCTRGCTGSSDCPGAGVCVDFGGGGTCFLSCVSNSQCEPGWGCTEVAGVGSMCLPGDGTPPGIPPYNSCSPPGTVGGCSEETDGCAAVTVDGVTGAFCTNNCASSSECPIDSRGTQGVCLRFGSNPSICFETCTDDVDCLTGFSCKPPDVGLAPVCLPTG